MKVQPINSQEKIGFGAKIRIKNPEIYKYVNRVDYLHPEVPKSHGMILDMFEKCAPNHTIEINIEKISDKKPDLYNLVAKNLNTKSEAMREIKLGFEYEWENCSKFYSMLLDLLTGSENTVKNFWGGEYKKFDYTEPNNFMSHSVFNA